MSMALTHFAVGAAITVLLVALLVPRTPYPRVLGLLGGIWGMIPDAYWVFPVYAAELRPIHASPLANVFWFHRTLDLADPTDSKAVAAAALAGLVVATLLAEHRQYRALASIRTAVGIETDGGHGTDGGVEGEK